jgi:hypothetical protein
MENAGRRLTVKEAIDTLDLAADYFDLEARKRGVTTPRELADRLRQIRFMVDPSLTVTPEPIKTAKVSTPRCMGCGTTVPEQGMVCPVCADLPRFNGMNVAPKATIETAPQPEPAYRDGAPPVPLVP